MDTKITEIEILLDKLNLLFGSIKNDGQIDKLELELLKRYTQQLHDKVQSVEALKVQTEMPKPIIQQVIKPEEPLAEQDISPMVDEQKTVEKIIPVGEPKLEPIIEKIVEKINPEVVSPIKVESPVVEKKDPPIAKPETKKKLIAQEEVEDEEYSTGLNNKLFNDKKTLADKISSVKGKDIKSVIDLNEKLFFINKLFKGDKDAYEQSIKTLNVIPNLTEAERFIGSDLKHKFQWQDEAAIERLKEVVRAKFE